MGLASLRRYDVQAKYALLLSVASTVPFLAAAALAARNYEPTLGQIVYGSEGNFVPMFLGCVVLSMVPSVVAMILGISSAGQRRNDKPTHSWIGFVVGGSVLTFDLILVIALLMLRLQRPM